MCFKNLRLTLFFCPLESTIKMHQENSQNNSFYSSRPPPSNQPPGPKPFVFDGPRSFELGISIVVCIVNIAEIIVIARIKRRKTIYEKLLLSLSIADSLFGFVNGLQQVMRKVLSGEERNLANEIASNIYFFFIFTSLNHVLVISLDRLWAICSPMKHRVIVTRGRIHIAIAIIWISTAVITALILMYAFLGKDIHNQERIIREVVRCIAILVLVADGLILIINIITMCVIKKRTKVTEDGQSNSKHKATERVVQIVCTTIVVMFILFTAPWSIVELTYGKPNWTHILFVVNSGMNSVVYFFKGYIARSCVCCVKRDLRPGSSVTINTIN